MQQLAFILPIIVVIWVMILAIRIGMYLDKKAGRNLYNPVVIEKVCPPHKWDWVKQPGIEEAIFYIRCQKCRRLPGYEN